jgi:hypothetical protein
MTILLKEYTTDKQRSGVRFLWAKGLNAKDFHKEMFPVYIWKCFSCKTVHNWVEKFSEGRSKVAYDARQVRKWLRQQSKDFYVAGFDALVKRWGKCINVGRGYVEKYIFSLG